MSARSTVLVTGGAGFVGQHLTNELLNAGHAVRVVSRSVSIGGDSVEEFSSHCADLLGAESDWRPILEGVDCVVHLAAHVHIMKKQAQSRRLYYEINSDGTERLASFAEKQGVRRFIFLSSVKVNGECNLNAPFAETDLPSPIDDYGKSKLEAEQRLFALANKSELVAVAIRSPLVYGPGVRANFSRLLSLIDLGVPLPLEAIRNSRSLVSVWNLCNLIRTVVEASSIRSSVFMASDGEDLSTPELVRRIAKSMGKPARMFPMPVLMLKLLGKVTGKSDEVARLCDSLAVNISAAKNELNWSPPVTVDESLARTVQWFLKEAVKGER